MAETRDTILVLGTGATRGGGFRVKIGDHQFQPPLDRDFFTTPAVQSIFNAKDYPALYHYWQGWQEPSLEGTWSKIDLYFKLCSSHIMSEEQTDFGLTPDIEVKGEKDQAYRLKAEQEERHCRIPSMALWEIRCLVREVYGNLVPPERESPLKKLVWAVRDNCSLKAIVTFNYDTSLEAVLRDVGTKPFYPHISSEGEGDPVVVFKLHGSLNWQTSTKPESRDAPIRALDVNKVADMNHGRGWYEQPEIIGPTFFKQEIAMDTEKDFRAQYYKRLWASTWDCLGLAKRIVFVGFSFPSTDFHAAALFQSAHVSGHGFDCVVVCHKGDANTPKTMRNVFSGRTDNPPQFTEFDDGLEGLVARKDELLALLKRPG